jgi:type IX secretion system PorP/SprF family membrane protein
MERHNRHNGHLVRRWKLLLLFLPIGIVQAQQNIQFTQYMFNSLAVNPAYAGYKDSWNAQATHRMQWMSLPGAPVTSQLSVDGLLDTESKNVGLGLQFTNDQLGAQSATSLYLDYAYRLPLDLDDTQRLCFGLGAGVTQYGLDGSVLDPVNSEDPLLSGNYEYSYIPDLRFGVYYFSKKWYAGVSVMDMLSGDKSNRLFNWQLDSTVNVMRKRHYYIMGGVLLDLTKELRLRPGLLYKTDLKGPASLDVSLLLIMKDLIWVGASYRTALPSSGMGASSTLALQNSVSGLFRIQIAHDFYVGYSFDWALTQLNTVENGTHEITVGWTLPRKYQRVLSPRFF